MSFFTWSRAHYRRQIILCRLILYYYLVIIKYKLKSTYNKLYRLYRAHCMFNVVYLNWYLINYLQINFQHAGFANCYGLRGAL